MERNSQRNGGSPALEPHVHHFTVINPYQPAGDKCECGVARYDLMGPFERRKARLAAYDQMGAAFGGKA